MIQYERRLERNRARDDVRGLLRDMILSGELASDARIEEIDLAVRIGVSRTPVREALIGLEREGLVKSKPHKGFTVAAADVAMVRETYPILGGLEVAALRLGWPQLKSAASELADLNRKLHAAATRPTQYQYDQAFHERLTRDCGNPRLLELITIERVRARRFDGAELRGTANHAGSCAEHAKIVAAIKAGKPEAATEVLQAHWDHGVEVVAAWLESQ